MSYDSWLEKPYADAARNDEWAEWCEERGYDPEDYTPEDYLYDLECEAADRAFDYARENPSDGRD